MTLAQALVDEILADPGARARLTAGLGIGQAPTGPERFVDARAVAVHLGYELGDGAKPHMVYEATKRPDDPLPHHRRPDGRILFRLSEVEAWAEGRAPFRPRTRRRKRLP